MSVEPIGDLATAINIVTQLKYGPSLCPGCIECLCCKAVRTKAAELLEQLLKSSKELDHEDPIPA